MDSPNHNTPSVQNQSATDGEKGQLKSHEPDAANRGGKNDIESEGDESQGEEFDARAVCDRCDQRISGSRYKCKSCPDFDYCSKCFADASLIHPGHSFTQLEGLMPDSALEETDTTEDNTPGPGCKLVQESSFAVSSPSKCTSCAPVTEPLSAIHLILKDPKVPRNISLRWPLRISKLIEATQLGCAFCCFCLRKFFGPGNGQTFAYRPSKPWYAEPSKHDKERDDLVEHCMETLTRLKRDVFEFRVTPLCTKKGSTMPDFDRLEITLHKDTEKIHVIKDLRGVFNSAGNIGMEMDVFALGSK